MRLGSSTAEHLSLCGHSGDGQRSRGDSRLRRPRPPPPFPLAVSVFAGVRAQRMTRTRLTSPLHVLLFSYFSFLCLICPGCGALSGLSFGVPFFPLVGMYVCLGGAGNARATATSSLSARLAFLPPFAFGPSCGLPATERPLLLFLLLPPRPRSPSPRSDAALCIHGRDERRLSCGVFAVLLMSNPVWLRVRCCTHLFVRESTLHWTPVGVCECVSVRVCTCVGWFQARLELQVVTIDEGGEAALLNR